MKKLFKNLKFKFVLCMALVGAVLFSCAIVANPTTQNVQDQTVAAGARFDISDTLDAISTYDSVYNMMDDYPITPGNQTNSNISSKIWA